jgi:hypothetical protein
LSDLGEPGCLLRLRIWTARYGRFMPESIRTGAPLTSAGREMASEGDGALKLGLADCLTKVFSFCDAFTVESLLVGESGPVFLNISKSDDLCASVGLPCLGTGICPGDCVGRLP